MFYSWDRRGPHTLRRRENSSQRIRIVTKNTCQSFPSNCRERTLKKTVIYSMKRIDEQMKRYWRMDNKSVYFRTLLFRSFELVTQFIFHCGKIVYGIFLRFFELITKVCWLFIFLSNFSDFFGKVRSLFIFSSFCFTVFRDSRCHGVWEIIT